MEKIDYQAITDLKNSQGWKILCDELDLRIKAIEEVLLLPDDSDIFTKMTEKEQLKLISYKKAERIYLIKLKEMPQELLATKVTIQKKD